MTIITNINIQTFFTITFGESNFSPTSGNLNTTINEHAKIAGLIEAQTSWETSQIIVLQFPHILTISHSS